jgi:outer membrane protein assembly factor BamB
MAMTDVGDIKVPFAPAFAGDSVVAVGHAGQVHLIDGATGRLIWTQVLAEKPGASACDGQAVSVGIAEGIVLAGSMGHVFALRLEDGSMLWHTALRGRGAGETSLAVGGLATDYVARLES